MGGRKKKISQALFSQANQLMAKGISSLMITPYEVGKDIKSNLTDKKIKSKQLEATIKKKK